MIKIVFYLNLEQKLSQIKVIEIMSSICPVILLVTLGLTNIVLIIAQDRCILIAGFKVVLRALFDTSLHQSLFARLDQIWFLAHPVYIFVCHQSSL